MKLRVIQVIWISLTITALMTLGYWLYWTVDYFQALPALQLSALESVGLPVNAFLLLCLFFSFHNLSSDATCNFGAGRDSVNLKLGKLKTNGGASMTHRLLSGSPAIDNGVFVVTILTDQRGTTRPRGASFDAGAFEFIPCNSAPLAATALAPTNGTKINTPKVALDWAGPDCVKAYSVVVRLKKPSGAVVFSKSKLKLSQVTTGTLNPSKYVWQVTACNGSACTSSPWFKFKL